MGRPATRGAKLIFNDKGVIGVCLGSGGYSEHNFYDTDQEKNWVKKFNLVPDNPLFYSQMFGLDYTSLKEALKTSKQDIKLLKKLRKDVEYNNIADFILRPHLNIYERIFTFDNSSMREKGKRNVCFDEKYNVLCIEGSYVLETYKHFFEKKVGQKRIICESDILYSSDYDNSFFTEPQVIVSSYTVGAEHIMIMIKSDSPNVEILNTIKDKLSKGYLALKGNYNGQYYGACLLFMDRILYGKDMNT